jgi:hypothetical protein
MKLLSYLYWIIFKNWKTTVASVILGIIVQYIPDLEPHKADAITAIIVAIGVLLPDPGNISTMLLIFLLPLMSCSLIKSVGCDKIAAVAEQAARIACEKSVYKSLGSAAGGTDTVVIAGDTVALHRLSTSEGTRISWLSEKGDSILIIVRP